MTVKTPNPQGKGLVPVLDSLVSSRTHLDVPPKRIEQIASELFTSMFVLESQFQFKPVVGQSYWLYRKNKMFTLSLIAPQEWSPTMYGQAVAECVLQHDLTWTLMLTEASMADAELQGEISEKRVLFESMLEQTDKVENMLPVFVQGMPFYQRVFASALAHSLKISMQKSGILQLSYQQAVNRLVCHDDSSAAGE